MLILASLSALLVVTGVRAYRSAQAGAELLADGARLAGGGDVEAAERQLQRAEWAFGSALTVLDRWWLWPAERLPLVHRQVKAAHALAQSGSDLAVAGQRLAKEIPVDALRLVDGTLDLEAVARLGGPLEAGLSVLRHAHADLTRARVPWLLPPLDRRLAQVSTQVRAEIVHGETSVLATRVVPGLFGATGPRRYFLAIQTLAEPRGTGGMIGNFGEVTAEGGTLRLARLGRTAELNEGGDPAKRRLSGPSGYLARYGRFDPERTWQNVNMSPDFPSVGKVIDELYPQSGGQPVDGVVGLDPFALAALLALTGPVTVPAWPEPLTADNAADVLVRQQYLRFEGAERVDFLDSTARAIFDRLTTTSLPSFPTVARALAPVIRSGHLTMWSDKADEQVLFHRVGASGGLPEVRGDFVATVVQDATGSKLAPFLHRSVRYLAVFDPAKAEVRAQAVVRLDNQAPSSGLPATVTGALEGMAPGHNRVYFSLYTPLVFEGATLDGGPLLMESMKEHSRNVYSAFVTIPPGQSATLVAHLAGPVQADRGYRLDIAPQPAITADNVDVEVRVVGRDIVAADGLEARGDAARGRFELSEDRAIRLRTQSVPVTGSRWRLEFAAVAALAMAFGLHLRHWGRRGWAWAGPQRGPRRPGTTMPKSSNGAPRARKRAHLVSIRTLHRVADVVGQNEAGEPIVKVGATRLVLLHGDKAFCQLASCSGCGEETVSRQVRTSADLSRGSPVFCSDCTAGPSILLPLHAEPPEDAAADQARGQGQEPGDRLTESLWEELREPVDHMARNGRTGPDAEDGIPRSQSGTPGDALASEVGAAVVHWLEQHEARLLSEVHTVMSRQLQEHREVLARELAAVVAHRDGSAQELSAVAIRRFDDRQSQVTLDGQDLFLDAWRAATADTAEAAGAFTETVLSVRTSRGRYRPPTDSALGWGSLGALPGGKENA